MMAGCGSLGGRFRAFGGGARSQNHAQVREFVRKMFHAIQDDDGSTARVVCEDGDTVGADGREKMLCLFLNALQDDTLLRYVVEAREAAK